MNSFALLVLRDGLALAFCAAAFLLTIHILLPATIRWLYRRSVPVHGFSRNDGSEGAGSEDLRYLPMAYDCRHQDVVVTGRAPEALYWGVGVFDGTLRILEGGHLNHRTARIDAEGRWEVRLSVAPRAGEDCLDCSSCRRGLFIFRVLLPTGEVELPRVRLQPRRP